MTNPKIAERVRSLYERGLVDAEKLTDYVNKGIITEDDMRLILEGAA